jgi:hypothetical protein
MGNKMNSEKTNNIFDKFSTKCICRCEPILLKLSTSDIPPIIFGISISITTIIIRSFAALRVGHLFTTGNITGFLETPAIYVGAIYGSAIWTFYIWIPKGITKLFKGLSKNKIIIGTKLKEDTDNESNMPMTDKFQYDMEKSYGKCIWPIISMLISTISILLFLLPQYLDKSYSASVADVADTFSLILTTGWALFALYSVLISVIFVAITIYWLYQTFNKFRINIRPLHPDHSGGLSPLGNFSLRLSYFIVVIGFILIVTPITRNYVVDGSLSFRWTTELLLSLSFYLLLAPIVFFAPISVAHNAMLTAKSNLLLRIANRFDKEFDRIQVELKENNGDLDFNTENLKKLQLLHDTTNQFPVWPFSLGNIKRFISTYISPLLLGLIADLLTRFL